MTKRSQTQTHPGMSPYLLEPKPAICFPFTSCHFLLRAWLLRLTLLPGQETIMQEMERCGSVAACRVVLGMTLNPCHLSVTPPCMDPTGISASGLQLWCPQSLYHLYHFHSYPGWSLTCSGWVWEKMPCFACVKEQIYFQVLERFQSTANPSKLWSLTCSSTE